MIFALVGNQNCGKTTLFNALTGSNQHVGNFPGVTVDQKMGEMRDEKDCSVVDLPGIYSLRPYTQEEIVSRDFIINEKPDGIINIVDATNIERNLYLTLQLLELRVPMVLALNMMDEVRANGGAIDVQKMSDALGIPVVPISAAKGEGVSELVDQALSVARSRTLPKVTDFCSDDSAVHRCIHAVVHIIADHADRIGVPARFCAAKLIEGGDDLAQVLDLDENERELLEHCIVQMENETGLDRNAALADMRYTFIESVVAASVVKCHESKEHARSMKIDRILTGKYTAMPTFLLVMLLTFYLTFNVVGKWLSDLLQLGIDALTGVVDAALTAYGINPVVHSLIIDGVFAGVGSVLVFLPIIVTLFFFLSILEDTGYMARVAFVMDKPLRDRPVRAQHRADAHRLRLLGAGHHGHAHRLIRPRPENDHPAHAVHELLGEDLDLCVFHRGIFPALPRARHAGTVCARRAHRHRRGAHHEQDGLSRQARAVCHGAAELPHARAQERGAAALGEGEGFPPARVHGHLPRNDHHLVLAEL